jgi:fibronectin-binding autotransporter adhesin
MTMAGMNFVLGHNNALGTGLVEVAAASPVISATTPLTAINTPFQYTASGAADNVQLITLSGSNAMTFNGNLSWSGNGTSGLTRGFNVTSSEVMTWNGVISQTDATRVRNFRKSGSGTLVLGGANTYGLTTGTTTVAEGTLLVSNTNGSATGLTAVVVNSAAVIGGNGSIGGNLTLASGALFAFDTGSTLDLSGTLALDSSFGVASLRNTSGGAIDWSAITSGTYTLMNTSFAFNATNISNFGGTNAYTIGSGTTAYFQQGSGPSSLQLVVVPEPAALSMAAVGMVISGLVARRLRRR